MIAEFLVALFCVGAASCDEKNDVRYSGPVVYTNLPPPLLYFPSFPDRKAISNRGDGQEGGNKGPIEYVPFPYKDLPLLVYQSNRQPPVHVVEKGTKDDEDEQAYHQAYSSDESDEEAQSEDAQADDKGSAEQTSGHQYIGIGLTSIPPQTDSHAQGQVQYGPVQYGQTHQVRYVPQTPGESIGPAYAFYPAHQESHQTGGGQPQQQMIPVEQLRQVVQSYVTEQGTGQQVDYGQQSVQQTGGETATQHVGITIIHQPEGDGPQAPAQQQNVHSGNEQSDPQLLDGNQQFVSIGVFPINIPGADPKQLYNVMAPVPSHQYPEDGTSNQYVQQPYPTDQGGQQHVYGTSEQPYQTGNIEYTPQKQQQQQHSPNSEDYRMVMNPQPMRGSEGYRQSNKQKAPASGPPPPPQTPGYQVISIDLSTLTNQNAAPPNTGYRQMPPPPRKPQTPPPVAPPVQQANAMDQEYQTILIHVPSNLGGQGATQPVRGRGSYAGPAQPARKPSHAPPAYNRPPQKRPPPPPQNNNYQQQRKPTPVQQPQSAGLLGNSINIAIIKQSDTSGQYPAFQPPPPPADKARAVLFPPRQPSSHDPRVRPPSQSSPRRPSAPQAYHHQGQRTPNFGPNHLRQNSPPRYQGQRMQASSNLHYTAVLPPDVAPKQLPAKRPRPVSVQSSVPKSSYAKLMTMDPAKILNGFDDVSFDDINAFLSSSYDLFGDKNNNKAMKEDIKFLQSIAGDILEPPLRIVPVPQPRPSVVPLVPTPLPYRYWEQPVYGPRAIAGHYSLMQYPHVRGGKPLPVYGRGKPGYRGLRKKLSSLIRGRSKIAPRKEEEGFDFVPKNLLPRSGTQKPSLDGISIPLRSISTSRISEDDEDEEGTTKASLPPIIVYKGLKPPVEIYGSRGDIEKDNKTMEDPEEPQPTQRPEEPQQSKKSGQAMSERRTGYLDYMYSMLPELLMGSLGERFDNDRSQWLPVGSTSKESSIEDTYDRNGTATTALPDSTDSPAARPQNSSSRAEASLKEDIEQLFTLLGREEKTDLIRD